MVVVDTSIIIDHLRQQPVDTALMKLFAQTDQPLAISVITIQELYRGTSTRHKSRSERMTATIESFQILPYTSIIAQKAGELTRDQQRFLEFADAAIAATTIANNASLYTLNVKDFKDIPHLELLTL